ncbi:hypothetical protein CH267_10905 [Rhodococcus sp. 06-621-2]|nr:MULTISPECIES: DUF2637 domain-containing protein [unclassified Rhodococcus (in: high G+C Gram-positive bacteria)]OZC56063.1 hypothetical protein CH267_10905 [Rhodococcus sp. 06-621-2]OZD69096.1 hypothetical protein CH263_08090 [Rhodococcus sp. 06-1059B-a]
MDNANTHTHQTTTEDTREIHPAVITWALAIGLVVAFVVTASSFKLSFTTLLDLGSMAGLRDSAWVIPVVLDGPILAASILRIALSQHTDRRTVLGRRFIIAVYALAGVASMAGNAYHAVLTVTDLNAAVAAAMGALAPLMVMTMAEMMSVAISAPRRRIQESASPDPETASQPGLDDSVSQRTESDLAAGTEYLTDLVDDHGFLRDDVWETADLYLNHPDAKGNFSAVARILEINVSTVTRRYDKWIELMQKVAAEKARQRAADRTESEPVDDAPQNSNHASISDDRHSELDSGSFVGASR